MPTTLQVHLGDRKFPLTNPHKVLWPREHLTKADLINYYLQVAELMSPYLAGRHLVFTRYPDGIAGKWFYQKDCPAHAPRWLHTRPHFSQGSGRTLNFITGADAATLAWLGNQACLEVHGWLSLADQPQTPQWAVFDLDPAPPAGFAQAVTVAQHLRELLDALEVRSYVKTSGGSGLHVFVPVKPGYSYAQTRGFVQAIGALLRREHPRLITLARPVAQRNGRVYIDYLQNGLGKTMVMPYSPRPLPGAPVSMPLDWSELQPAVPSFGLANLGERLVTQTAFARVLEDAQTLPGLPAALPAPSAMVAQESEEMVDGHLDDDEGGQGQNHTDQTGHSSGHEHQ